MKDIPLSEITLRKYEKPVNLEKRELMRKICLSLGLLQLGDSRDVIVDIFLVLIEANRSKERLNSYEIKDRVEELRKNYSLEIKGIAESNIRRQLKRLRDAMYVDKSENRYYLIEHSQLKEIFERNIEKFVIPPIIERVKEYLDLLNKTEIEEIKKEDEEEEEEEENENYNIEEKNDENINENESSKEQEINENKNEDSSQINDQNLDEKEFDKEKDVTDLNNEESENYSTNNEDDLELDNKIDEISF